MSTGMTYQLRWALPNSQLFSTVPFHCVSNFMFRLLRTLLWNRMQPWHRQQPPLQPSNNMLAT